ncbi:MAG: caspase family protein [Acidobacteria bacterium]|nr:caspase family protein [Acidobacteriota bacterium]
MTKRALVILILVLLPAAVPAVAESPNCTQARSMVADAQAMVEAGHPDYAAILSKMKTATGLCAALGDAWKHAYCSAVALGDKKASFYRDQAVLNGVKRLECGSGASGATQAPVPLPSHVRDKYALVIGIGKFKDPDIPTLQFPAKDARDLAAVLKDPKYGRFDPAHVVLLTDEQATRANILSALNDLIGKAKEDDLVFLYFSSHGSPHQEDAALQGVGYIVTYDTSRKSLFIDALEYEDFSRKVALIKARRKVAFLDTCYSGQAKPGAKGLFIEDGRGIDDKTARLFLSGEGTYVVTSSKSSERSFESETLHNGYFTYYLINALKAGSEPPTVRQVFDVLSREVPAAVLKDKGAPQHPQILPEDGRGDVRIGVSTVGSSGNP